MRVQGGQPLFMRGQIPGEKSSSQVGAADIFPGRSSPHPTPGRPWLRASVRRRNPLKSVPLTVRMTAMQRAWARTPATVTLLRRHSGKMGGHCAHPSLLRGSRRGIHPQPNGKRPQIMSERLCAIQLGDEITYSHHRS